MSSMWKGAVPDPYLNSILNKYQKKNIVQKKKLYINDCTNLRSFRVHLLI